VRPPEPRCGAPPREARRVGCCATSRRAFLYSGGTTPRAPRPPEDLARGTSSSSPGRSVVSSGVRPPGPRCGAPPREARTDGRRATSRRAVPLVGTPSPNTPPAARVACPPCTPKKLLRTCRSRARPIDV
jgi:hypothetical protein